MIFRVLNVFLIWGVIVCFSFSSFAQELQTKNLFSTEEITVGVGVGLEYGVLGFKAKYTGLHKNISPIINIGLSEYAAIWNFGLEARLNPEMSRHLSPYVSLCYGVNGASDLDSRYGVGEARSLYGFNMGFGLNVKFRKKGNSYLSLGGNYRIISARSKDIIDDFKEKYDIRFGGDYISLIPSLGIFFVISEKDKVADKMDEG